MERRRRPLALGHGGQSERNPMSQVDTPPVPPADPAPEPAEKLTFDWLIHTKRGWQHGEQGIIEAIIGEIEKDIPAEHLWAVEFGAGDGGKLPLTTDMLVR